MHQLLYVFSTAVCVGQTACVIRAQCQWYTDCAVFRCYVKLKYCGKKDRDRKWCKDTGLFSATRDTELRWHWTAIKHGHCHTTVEWPDDDNKLAGTTDFGQNGAMSVCYTITATSIKYINHHHCQCVCVPLAQGWYVAVQTL